MISGARGKPQGRRYRPGTSLGSHGRATDRHLVARVEATGQEATWTTWLGVGKKSGGSNGWTLFAIFFGLVIDLDYLYSTYSTNLY